MDVCVCVGGGGGGGANLSIMLTGSQQNVYKC